MAVERWDHYAVVVVAVVAVVAAVAAVAAVGQTCRSPAD